MNPSIAELLRQGLAITVAGMGLVFGALALFWGVIALLGRVSAPTAAEPAAMPVESMAQSVAEVDQRVSLTAERARVAAIVAGALIANSVPLRFEPPPGPTFEHGRTAPAWVTTHRARIMRPWQPPRFTEK